MYGQYAMYSPWSVTRTTRSVRGCGDVLISSSDQADHIERRRHHDAAASWPLLGLIFRISFYLLEFRIREQLGDALVLPDLLGELVE